MGDLLRKAPSKRANNHDKISCLTAIDLLAILQKTLDRAILLYILIHDVLLTGVRASVSHSHKIRSGDYVSVLCTFENPTKSNEISFDPHSFLE